MLDISRLPDITSIPAILTFKAPDQVARPIVADAERLIAAWNERQAERMSMLRP